MRERYILSIDSPHIVKIRDDCLDIRMLLSVDQTGLEQWRPLVKASFPIEETALEAAWLAWSVPAPIVSRRQCNLSEFLFEIVDHEPELCVAEIERKRTPVTIQGCGGEHIAIQVVGESWESIAFKHTNPFQVWRAVTALGLQTVENTSYPAALKQIVGIRAGQASLQKAEM
jgi:exopolyphosphatase/guanosine-5'-triphosphate,3'-diphosphate pyrophosphatase